MAWNERSSERVEQRLNRIGQAFHNVATRTEVIEGCGWMGAMLDPGRNANGKGRISAETSSIPVWSSRPGCISESKLSAPSR